MNKVLIAVVVVLLAACSREPAQPGIASDGPEAEQPRSEPRIARDTPVNPMPLGFELDYANLEGVKSKLSGVAELEDRGTLELTNGPLLATTGTDLGVEGLKGATFAFNGSGTLEGVVLTFPRGPSTQGQRGSSRSSWGRSTSWCPRTSSRSWISGASASSRVTPGLWLSHRTCHSR